MKSLLIGAALLLALIATVAYFEGVTLSMLLQWHNLLLVLGGSYATAAISFGFKKSLKMFKLSFLTKHQVPSPEVTLAEWRGYADFAAKHSVIKLDTLTNNCKSVLGTYALVLLSDNKLSAAELEARLLAAAQYEHRRKAEIANIWSTVGERAPYTGIIGTVFSMLVLWSSANGSDIMAGLGSAFTATLYGIGLLLLCQPVAQRIHMHLQEEKEQAILIIQAAKAIHAGKRGLQFMSAVGGQHGLG